MEGIAVHRIVNGRMVEHWAQVDALGLLQQLGAVPAPGETP
jgi:predicted ester cyclase